MMNFCYLSFFVNPLFFCWSVWLNIYYDVQYVYDSGKIKIDLILNLYYSLTINSVITQWSVLALRNLCENNNENQAVIAGLSQKGVVSSPVLTELGFTLHSEGGKDIKLVPLK